MIESQNVWLAARKAFLPFRGVVGVGYGPKLTQGKITTRHAIIVLVEKKLPRHDIRKEQVIPIVFLGLPTDVREPRLNIENDDRDFCTTDHQWIDAMKIHRMRLEQRCEPG
jgi:hypothetical protein